jgi:hypothetical protein
MGDTARGVVGIVHVIHVLFWLWGMLEKVLHVIYMMYTWWSGCKEAGGYVGYDVHVVVPMGDTARGVVGIVHDIHVLFWLWGMLEKVLHVIYMMYTCCSGCKGAGGYVGYGVHVALGMGNTAGGVARNVYMLFWLWGMLEKVVLEVLCMPYTCCSGCKGGWRICWI